MTDERRRFVAAAVGVDDLALEADLPEVEERFLAGGAVSKSVLEAAGEDLRGFAEEDDLRPFFFPCS